MSGVKQHDKVETNLKQASPWYVSVRDPIQGAGAKIPDDTGIPTATLQMVQKISVQANAQGLAGLQVNTPFVNNVITGGSNFYTSAATSAPGALTWNSPQGVTAALSLQAIAQSHRVVSAALYAQYEGSDLNNSGDMVSYVAPWSSVGTSPNNNIPFLQSLYGSSTVPISNVKRNCVVSRYFPCSKDRNEYTDFYNVGYTGIGNPNCPFWSFGIIAEGLTGTPTILFTLVINYEFIPQFNTQDYVSAMPSPVDPIETEFVETWVSTDPQTGTVPAKQVEVNPGSQLTTRAEVDQGLTSEAGFGMIGSLIRELAPLAIAAL